ncbi:Uncharacterized protein APZ42_028726 [Daphnia magna]|uniref:Uncharacterized protein n=1 Tax=Daphnia magna TaxID=35525 RepID=A0A164QAP5_9CRUS|nr:Uncharacterized protein APZ42_028726 [Daphnia magna]
MSSNNLSRTVSIDNVCLFIFCSSSSVLQPVMGTGNQINRFTFVSRSLKWIPSQLPLPKNP